MMLEIQDLHKTYRLGRVPVPVLRGASISVAEGEWVAILGASGSGKSTLLHLSGGLDRPDRGSREAITFDGRCLGGFGSRELDRYRAHDVGFVFQFYHLIPELTVLENALTPAMIVGGRVGFMRHRASSSSRAKSLLETFGLSHRLKHRPAELSGGERQRVAMARALLNRPRLLLADEPTGNLDQVTGQALLEVLKTCRETEKLTILMVTHDPGIAAQADRVVQLRDGVVASS